jgi:putative DNA primase/helicase
MNGATFRGMVLWGGNYSFDFTDQQQRKSFIESFGESKIWKRVFQHQDPETISYDESKKYLYLMEVVPFLQNSASRFYVDYDSLKLFSPEKIVESALEWTRLVCGKDCRLFSFVSQKANGEKRLHFYWPDIVLNNKKEMYRLALSLNVCTGLECDFSVYSTGLRLPGCYRGRSEKDAKSNQPTDVAYYVWFNYLCPNQPSIDDILLVPNPDQQIFQVNWDACDKLIGKSKIAIDELIETMPGSGGTKTRSKNNKKRKVDPQDNEVEENDEYDCCSNDVEEEMFDKWGKWNNTEIPQRVWDLVEKYTGFKGPFKIQKQGNQKYSWIVDYDHSKSHCALLGPGEDKHDRVGFLLFWNPKTDDTSYYCLSGKCRKHRWIKKTSPQPTALSLEIDEIELDNAIHPFKQFSHNDSDTDNNIIQRKLPPFNYDIIFQLAQTDIDRAVEYFNNYMVVFRGSYWCNLDTEWSNLSRAQVTNQLSHIQTPNGKLFFDVWCTHPNHRIVKRIRLIPRLPDGLPKDELNVWTGYALNPSNLPKDQLMESVGVWDEHIRKGWCREDPSKPSTVVCADYCVKLIAHIVQKPWIKTGVPVVLSSRPGAGKNAPFVPLQKIMGQKHCWVISDLDEVFGSFNSHVSQAIIVVFDEVVYNKSRKVANKLKNFATADTMPLKEKYCNMVQLDHYANTFILSNNRQVIPLDAGDRRYFVLAPDNSKTGRSNYATYKDYYDRVRNVDPSHLLQYLLSIDLSDFDPRQIPDTEEHFKQLMLSLAPVPQFLFNFLRYTPDHLEHWFDSDKALSTIYDEFDRSIPNHHTTKALFFEALEADFKIKREPQRKRVDNFEHPQHYIHFPSRETLKIRFAQWADKKFEQIFGEDEDQTL